jgi:succinyl-diaminopimelate desuccinylase
MSSNDELLQRIRSDIDNDSQKIQGLFLQMLRIKSVNPRMGGPGEVERALFLESFLKDEGFEVSRVDVRDEQSKAGVRPNLSAKIDGRDSSRTLWLISHMDTVPEGSLELWQTDPFEPVVKDGKIFARGSEDNGQALVGSLFALRELKKLGVSLPFNVGVWLVADEEFGSNYGIKHLIERGYFRKDDLIVVPDAGTPKGRDIEIAEKGLLWFKVTTKGKQVHASLPGKGLNAKRVGMRLASDIDRSLHRKYAATDKLYDEPLSTFEPTKAEANVPNVNTIPGIDVFYFDCRVLPRYPLDGVVADVKALVRKYEKEYEAHISFEIVESGPAGPATPVKSEVAVLLAEAVQRVARVRPRFVGIGGQTVGNLFRMEGMPTAVWSTTEDIPHEPNEFSWIKNLIGDTRVFAAIPLMAGPNPER